MQRNKLRSFPNQKNGRRRLYPFARPRMTDRDDVLCLEPKVFAAGSCLARTIEKSVVGAGLELVYQREKIRFGHSDAQRKQNFNRYNLGVIENEFRWAFDPAADAGCHSLIEKDGELVDMQVVWTFAHEPELARKVRRAYNADFATARFADLVIITLGAVDMWYDCETGSYLNGIVPRRISDATPGRFQLHSWTVEDFVGSLNRIRDILHQNTTRERPPRIAICVSPVAQPLAFGGDDSLIAETHGKSIQRVAAQIFSDLHDDVDYAPVYEFVVLTDRAYAYQNDSFNHVESDCVDRFFGDYLRAIGTSPACADAVLARGEALGLARAGALNEAASVLEAYTDRHGYRAPIAELHATLLPKLGRANELATTYLAHAEAGADVSWKSLKQSFRAAVAKQDRASAAHALTVAQGKLQQVGGGNPAELEELAALNAILDDLDKKLSEQQRLKEMKKLLADDPKTVADTLALRKADGFRHPQEHWLYAQALRKSDRREALAEFDEIVRSGSNYAKAASRIMIQMLSGKNADPLGFDLSDIQRRNQQLLGE